MPEFVGGIKYPVPGDAYNSAYGEPQWWKDLAETASAQIAAKADVGHSHSWAQITGKPSTFPPSAHTHSDLSNGTFSVDLSSAGAFALRSGSTNMVQWNASNGNLVAGNVPWARVTDKPTSFPSAWGDVSGKPSTYPPETHTHSGLNNGTFTWSITSAGAIAANAGGSNTWQIDANTGRLAAGNVPWARITDTPTSFPPATHTHDDRYPRLTLPDIPTNVTNILDMADGDYGERFGVNATPERGYPPVGSAGWLSLRSTSSGTVRWAIYRPYNNPGESYENKYYAGSWSGWVPVVDPAIFTRLAALEYDTGPRAFTPDGPGFTGEGRIVLQRVGDEVTCRFEAVGLVSTISDFSYLTDASFIPQGFRPGYADRPIGPMSNPNANPIFFIGVAQGSRFRYQTSLPASSGARIVTGQMKWKADTGARPTAPYPGTDA